MRHLIAFLGPLLLIKGAWMGGAWTLLPVIFIFGLLPVLDESIGQDDTNPSESGERRAWSDLPLRLFVPAQLGAIVFALHHLTRAPLPLVDVVGLTISLGVVTGSGGIVVAHELMHRRSRLDRTLAEILMTSVSYAPFCVEHVFGHHRRVATPEDPATSRLGEPVFTFVPRSILGGIRSAWGIEADRAARGALAAGSLRDGRVRWPLLGLAVCGAVAFIFGFRGLAVFLGQSAVAVGLLEVVNYIEHYGLLRQKLASGQYEAPAPRHSWNSSHAVSNAYLFNLARHSDHHSLASRPYERLRHWDETEAPQLPAGYPAMLLTALVPPLWFAVMDRRVQAWRETFSAGSSPR